MSQPGVTNNSSSPREGEFDKMGSSIEIPTQERDVPDSDMSYHTSFQTSLASTETLEDLTVPSHMGEVIAGQIFLPPFSNELNRHVALSVYQLLEYDDLQNTFQKLNELSLSHTIQNAANKVIALLQKFRASPSEEGLKRVSNAIKRLLTCEVAETSDLIHLYKVVSDHYNQFFDVQQESGSILDIINCYKEFSPQDDWGASPSVAIPACFVHAFIGKVYRQCSQALNGIVSKYLWDNGYSIDEISKSLIQDGKNSEIYDFLCGEESITKGFSIKLAPPPDI